jgi:N-acyl-D-amino-acid deacylase
MYAETPELLALAHEAARVGAPLVPHVRDEADNVLEAVGEFADVARQSGAPLHLSHLKVLGHPHLVDPLLALLDETGHDVELSFDQYPYGAGSTTLSAQLPPWALEGGAERTMIRLRDPITRATITQDIGRGLPGWQSFLGSLGAEAIVVAQAAGARGSDGGKSIAEIAHERRTDVPNAIVDLLVDCELDATMIPHYADEASVEAIFAHPRMLVGSDGIFGPHPHPRLYGTTARSLGDLALGRGIVPVEEVVARLTARAADRLGLSDRGRIRPGLRADLVLLEPDRFRDRATYARPCEHPDGVALVLVAGEAVWRDGKPTGARPGGVVRAPLPGA